MLAFGRTLIYVVEIEMKMAKADEDTFWVFVLDFCSTLFILQ